MMLLRKSNNMPAGAGGSTMIIFHNIIKNVLEIQINMVKEIQVAYLNTDAPMTLYDKRINPQVTTYRHSNGDVVSIPNYNILATTPANKLNEAQLKRKSRKIWNVWNS